MKADVVIQDIINQLGFDIRFLTKRRCQGRPEQSMQRPLSLRV